MNESTGGSRREFWRGMVDEWRRSGRTQVDFCRQRKVTIGTFRWWKSFLDREHRARTPRRPKRAARPDTTGGVLVPVEILQSGTAVTLELVLKGDRVVRLFGRPDREALRAVIETVESLPC